MTRDRAFRLTFTKVRKLLDYDPIAGKVTWKRRPIFTFKDGSAYENWNTKFAGKEAFASLDENGYRRGGIFGKTYFAHRIVWLMHYKKWPVGDLRHLNDNLSDNRIGNLKDNGRARKTKKIETLRGAAA